MFTSATVTSHPAFARRAATATRVPVANGTMAASVTAASPSRPRISVAGASWRSATLMNMKDAPQMSASAMSIARFPRLMGYLYQGLD